MGTQNEAILSYMRHVGPITQLLALNLCGCMRLSERIREIQRTGVSVKHEMVRSPDGKKRWARYSLKKENRNAS